MTEQACACGCGRTFEPVRSDFHDRAERIYALPSCGSRAGHRRSRTLRTKAQKCKRRAEGAARLDVQIRAVRLRLYGDESKKPSVEQVQKRLATQHPETFGSLMPRDRRQA